MTREINYLNNHKQELFAGHKVHGLGKVYWANMTTREVYAQSDLAEIGGSVNGYLVAKITDDWEITEADND